jgi:hypothetical protein
VSNSPKNVKTIQKNTNEISLFEGWPDFLTLLTIQKKIEPDNTCIILNSISFLEIMIPFLKDHNVYYWGQNDHAGDKAYTRLRAEGIYTIDRRVSYEDFKDLNDKLCGKEIPKKKSLFFPKY